MEGDHDTSRADGSSLSRPPEQQLMFVGPYRLAIGDAEESALPQSACFSLLEAGREFAQKTRKRGRPSTAKLMRKEIKALLKEPEDIPTATRAHAVQALTNFALELQRAILHQEERNDGGAHAG